MNNILPSWNSLSQEVTRNFFSLKLSWEVMTKCVSDCYLFKDKKNNYKLQSAYIFREYNFVILFMHESAIYMHQDSKRSDGSIVCRSLSFIGMHQVPASIEQLIGAFKSPSSFCIQSTVCRRVEIAQVWHRSGGLPIRQSHQISCLQDTGASAAFLPGASGCRGRTRRHQRRTNAPTSSHDSVTIATETFDHLLKDWTGLSPCDL